MTTKTKAPSRTAAPSPKGKAQARPVPTPAWTLEERLQRIEAMGQRIDSYIRFMCKVANLNGTSAEAKERAVTAFYEQLVIVEGQLARIHGELLLE